jgi:hypothetical protein
MMSKRDVRDVQAELKALRLHGMASAWADLMEQDGGSTIDGYSGRS